MRIAAYTVMIIALLTLLPWLAMAPMSLMAFDAGGSVMAYAVAGAMFAYPLWLLGWLWAAWKSVRSGGEQRAILLSIVGALPALALIGIIALSGH